MKSLLLGGVALSLLLPFGVSIAHHDNRFRKPVSRRTARLDILGRQAGYGPEYGECDTGKTCKEACGENFEQCKASTDLTLFCYNPVAGQKCCEDGNGKACDKGFYCTTDKRKKTWCCPDALTEAACASEFGFDPIESTSSSSSSTAKSVASSTSSSGIAASSTSSSTSTATRPVVTPFFNNTNSTGGNYSDPEIFTGEGGLPYLQTTYWCLFAGLLTSLLMLALDL